MTVKISPKDVFTLRKATGAGMMACKKALIDASGDLKEAEKIIKANAKNKAEKKKDRVTASGTVFAYSGEKGGALIEVKSETDFVARNALFQKFAENLAQLVFVHELTSADDLMKLQMSEGGKSVEDERADLVVQLGENIHVSKCAFMPSEGQKVTHYTHGQRIAVVLRWTGPDEVGANMAMQVAASDPLGLTKEDIPADIMKDEVDVFTKQVKELNKPEHVAEKILQGKIDKFVDSQILGGQEYICDTKQKVREYLKQQQAEVNAFLRMELGRS